MTRKYNRETQRVHSRQPIQRNALMFRDFDFTIRFIFALCSSCNSSSKRIIFLIELYLLFFMTYFVVQVNCQAVLGVNRDNTIETLISNNSVNTTAYIKSSFSFEHK